MKTIQNAFYVVSLAFVLAWPMLAMAQVQVQVPGSLGSPTNAPTLCGAPVVLTTDADITMTAAQWACNSLNVSSTVTLTATRNVIAPLTRGQQFTVYNGTTGGQTINIVGTSGTSVAVPNGTAIVVSNPTGTGYVQAGSATATAAGNAQFQTQVRAANGTFSFSPILADGSGNQSGINSVSRVGTGCGLNSSSACEAIVDTMTAPRTINSEHDVDSNHSMVFTGKGLNTNGNTWRIQIQNNDLMTSFSRGLHTGYNASTNCYTIGDCQGISNNVNCAMGSANGSDEGCEQSLKTLETTGFYVGPVVAGGSALSPALGTQTSSQNTLIDGTWLLDTTKQVYSGVLTGQATASTALPGQFYLPVTVTAGGATLPISTAVGLLTANITGLQQMTGQGTATSATLTLQTVGGGTPAFTTATPVCFLDAWPEQATVNSLTSLSGTTQVINVSPRYNHAVGAPVFQGGICGTYLNYPGDFAFSGMLPSFPVSGSLTGTDIYASWPVAGVNKSNAMPNIGASAETVTSAWNLMPGAEIVINNSTTYTNFVVEPHSFNYDVGDIVEDPHHPTPQMRGLQLQFVVNSPLNFSLQSSGLTINSSGPGLSTAFRPLYVFSNNPCSWYTICGGKLVAPNMITVDGVLPYANIFVLPFMPQNFVTVVRAPQDGTNKGNLFGMWTGAQLSYNGTASGTYGRGEFVSPNAAMSGLALCTPSCITGTKFMADNNGLVTAAGYVGPVTSPTGTCLNAGEWVFPQTGTTKYCPSAGGAWTNPFIGITFQTQGVNNGSQTTLNQVAGNGIDLTNSGANVTTAVDQNLTITALHLKNAGGTTTGSLTGDVDNINIDLNSGINIGGVSPNARVFVGATGISQYNSSNVQISGVDASGNLSAATAHIGGSSSGKLVCTADGTNCPGGSGTYSLGGTLSSSNVTMMSGGGGSGVALNSIVGLDGMFQIAFTAGSGSATPGAVFQVNFTASRGHDAICIMQNIQQTTGDPIAVFTDSGGSASPTAVNGFLSPQGGVLVNGHSYVVNVSCP